MADKEKGMYCPIAMEICSVGEVEDEDEIHDCKFWSVIDNECEIKTFLSTFKLSGR